MSVSESTFSGNSAIGYGGGIYGIDSELAVTTSTFSGNSANYGGGIHARDGSTATITDSTFSENTATTWGGGVYLRGTYSDDGDDTNDVITTVSVINSTIAFNGASTGGGLYINSGSDISLANTIVADNTATSADPDIHGTLDTDTNNLIGIWTDTSSTPGAQTLSGDAATPLDPVFVDTGNDDYRLGVTSPAVNAGDNTAAGGLATDLDGNDRIAYAIVDIGAYEYLPPVLYWDTNGDTAGFGDGTGTWSTADACWTTDPTGASTTQAWNNSGDYVAVFDNTAGERSPSRDRSWPNLFNSSIPATYSPVAPTIR